MPELVDDGIEYRTRDNEHYKDSHSPRTHRPHAASGLQPVTIFHRQCAPHVYVAHAPFSLPLIAIHSVMLPTGKVLIFSAEHGVPGIHGWTLNPETLALTDVQPRAGRNPDCAGRSFLAYGRLLVAGGTLQFDPLLGSKKAFIFDSFAEKWIQITDMAQGRWYPTNITIRDGRVLTMSGINDTNGAELGPLLASCS